MIRPQNLTPVEMFNNAGYSNESDIKKPAKMKEKNSDTSTEKTPANSFRSLLKKFASDTSFGGISKATLSDGYARRFLWFLISATCYGFTIYMCLLLVKTYLDKPIKTAVDIVYEKNIDFPSVTVCNLNQFRQSEVKKIVDVWDILRNYSNEHRNKSDENSEFEQNFNKQKKAFKSDFANDFDDMNGEREFNDVEIDEDYLIEQAVSIASSHYNESELRSIGHQFNTTILSCNWKGLDCLTGYFRQFWTQTWNWKYGNCFTFNPGGNETGHPLSVFRTSKPGPNYGLTLDINIQQDEYVEELTDEAGANIVVHNAKQIPFPYDEGITVPPGFSSSIAIRKESITRVDPFKNGSCHAGSKLKSDNIFRTYMGGSALKYSTKACMESCLATEQIKTCFCAEAKFAGFVDAICQSLDTECLSNVTALFKNSKLGCNAKCPQPCEHHSFRHAIMTSILTSKAKEAKQKKDFGEKTAPGFDFDDNFLRVRVFFEELNLQKIVQTTFYDLETLLGDIGGQLGLWVGISVISVAEFGELLVSLCIVAARKSRRKNKTKTSEIELNGNTVP